MSETDELLSGYEECRERLVGAIVAGLRHSEPVIRQCFAAENQMPMYAESPAFDVTGVGLYVDNDNTFILSLRNTDENWDKQVSMYPESWTNGVLGERGPVDLPEINDCLSFITSWCETWTARYEDSRSASPMCSHLLYLAAAEAMLDSRVCKELHRLRIDAIPSTDPEFSNTLFSYVVRERDDRFSMNYCDLVLAMRYTAQIFSGDILRQAAKEKQNAISGEEIAGEFARETGAEFQDGNLVIDDLRTLISWMAEKQGVDLNEEKNEE
jgi:hypothetical protein